MFVVWSSNRYRNFVQIPQSFWFVAMVTERLKCWINLYWTQVSHCGRWASDWILFPKIKTNNQIAVFGLKCYVWRGLNLKPGRFANFPVRPWVISPTFPFTPSRFAPESFRPLSFSSLSRFAHFPIRPRVVSPLINIDSCSIILALKVVYLRFYIINYKQLGISIMSLKFIRFAR